MRTFKTLLFIFFLFSFCSCSSFIVTTDVASQDMLNGQPSASVNKQVYLWGAIKSRAQHDDDEDEQCGGPISEVRVKKNFGQGFVTAITFGLVNLSTIEYFCAQE